MKNNIGFFTHEVGAPDHRKFLILRAAYGSDLGWAMEARFWALNCLIGQADECRIDTKLKGEKARLARSLELSLADLDHFLSILKDDAELIHNDDGVIWTDQTQEDLGRAMVARKDAQSRRNKRVAQRSADESKTSADEIKTSADEMHGAEQSREDRNSSKQADLTQNDGPSPRAKPKPPACLPSSKLQEIQTAILAAPWNSEFSGADLQAFADRLAGIGEDLPFVEFCVQRVTAERPRKPAGLFKSALLGYDAWLTEFRESRPKPPNFVELVRVDPPRCCGTIPKTNRREGVALCAACKKSWSWDSAFQTWVEDS